MPDWSKHHAQALEELCSVEVPTYYDADGDTYLAWSPSEAADQAYGGGSA